MMQYLIKTGLSAFIIVAVSELSKKNTLLGGLLASLPLVSILAMFWLYLDTKNPTQVADLSTGIFWMVLPSLSLFQILPFLLKKQVPFYGAMILSCLLTGLIYYGAFFMYSKLGIKV